MCRQLGYPDAEAALWATVFTSNSAVYHPIWMDKVHCYGNESQIQVRSVKMSQIPHLTFKYVYLATEPTTVPDQ